MGPTSADDDTPKLNAKFDGEYKNGKKNGKGKMLFPNGDIYEGEWVDDMVRWT